MKKLQIGKVRRWMLLLLMLPLMAGEAWAENNRSVPTGAVNGLFSVSANKKVYFSKGNLQYQASTNTWRFAANQWDRIGSGNSGISSSYSGWIDLFGWGTSGYNHGATSYQPWSTSTTDSYYYAYGSNTSHLYNNTGKADWGYNAISNGGNQENLWRTLTGGNNGEWDYLLNVRNTSSGIRYAKACVNGINGIIIVPDDWRQSTYTLNQANSGSASYSSNTITVSTWNDIIEPAGCVFLPTTGLRGGTIIGLDLVETDGDYWSSSYSDNNYASFFFFASFGIYPKYTDERCHGMSVRLVQNYTPTQYTINATANPTNGGTITGAGTFGQGESVTLTAQPNLNYKFVNWKESIMKVEVVFKLYDSEHDGWNGNKLHITYSDGTPEEDMTFDDGWSCTFTRGIGKNVRVNVTFVEGNWSDECSYTIKYGNGDIIHEGTTDDYEFTVSDEYESTLMDVIVSTDPAYSFTASSDRNLVANFYHVRYGFSSVCSTGQTLFYNVTDAVNHKVSLTYPTEKNDDASWDGYQKPVGDIVLSETVEFNGETYSVTGIGSSAFKSCSGLTGTLTIPNSVTTIGYQAFCGCAGFTGSLNIPNSVTSVGEKAFYGCNGFTGSLNIPNSLASIGIGAFPTTWNAISVSSGNSVFYSQNNALIRTNDKVLIVGCKNTIIPNDVTKIADYAFYNCSSLTGALNIPNTVTSIGSYAFYNCSGLTGSLNIPNTVTSIGNFAFYNCSGLTGSLTIDCCANYIGEYAFEDCNGFTGTLTIGNSVAGIGKHAFADCNNISAIILKRTVPPTIKSSTFNNVSRNIPVIVPCDSQSAYQSASYWNSFTNYQEDFNYTLTISSSNTNMGTVAVTQQPSCGVNAIVKATPKANYRFVNWTKGDNVVSTDAIYTFTVTEDITLVANFAINNYTISATANPAVGGTVTGAGEYNHGANVTLSASANEGYTFVNWTENDVEVSTSPNYSFTATADRTLVANFSLNSYTISASANPAVGGTVSGANTYNHGANVTLTANANEGYTFVNWTENDMEVSTSPTYSFTATADRTLVANFSLNSYTISSSANPSVGGTVSGANTYNHGANVTLTATANEGYTFINWTENDVEVSTSPNYSFTATADRSLVANFSLNSYAISASANPAVGGTVSGANTYNHGANVTLTATANEGYTFINWTENDVEISTSPTYSFTASAERTLVANFTLNSYTISASANPTVGGMITGAGEYNHGANVTLSASANEGYTFVNWTENDVEVSTSPTYSFTASAERTLVANFTLNSYTISASTNPSVGGTVTGAGEYNHGANVTLSASANEGYTFINWTENDEIVSTDATYIFTATADRELVANFTTSGLHWTYDISQFEDYMSVRGVVQIDGIEQRRTDLELGAFCGDECRGAKLAAYFPPMDKYIYQLPVYGNNGDVISFKLYDHQLGMELELTPPANVDYQLNGYGTLGNPYVFNFVSKVEISATANPAEAGTVSGTGDYAIGSTATLTAMANENYAFDRWTENGQTVSTDASYSFTVTEARVLTAEFNYVQTLSLPNGWNWISSNVELSDIDGLSILEQGVGENGEMIRTRNGQSVDYFEGYGWWGDLTSINNEEMYEVKTKANCNVPIEGQLCNPENHPITVNYGWNWIGCPIQNDVPLSTGLSDLNCYTDDIMKSHFAFSSYFEGFGWYGDVEMLNPGTGYKFYSNGNVQQTFVYQTESRKQAAIHTSMKERHFKADATLHKDNMSVIAVTLLDGVELKSSDYELAAFVSGECRGSVRLLDVEPLNRHLAYLTILGENNDQISYRLYDVATGISYQSDSSQDTVFSTDAIIGTQLIPNEIRFSSSNSDNIAVCELNLYPNPINRNETFVVEIPLAENEEAVIEVCNVLGEKLIRSEVAQSSIELKGPSVIGIYQIKAVVGKRVYYGKLIVK